MTTIDKVREALYQPKDPARAVLLALVSDEAHQPDGIVTEAAEYALDYAVRNPEFLDSLRDYSVIPWTVLAYASLPALSRWMDLTEIVDKLSTAVRLNSDAGILFGEPSSGIPQLAKALLKRTSITHETDKIRGDRDTWISAREKPLTTSLARAWTRDRNEAEQWASDDIKSAVEPFVLSFSSIFFSNDLHVPDIDDSRTITADWPGRARLELTRLVNSQVNRVMRYTRNGGNLEHAWPGMSIVNIWQLAHVLTQMSSVSGMLVEPFHSALNSIKVATLHNTSASINRGVSAGGWSWNKNYDYPSLNVKYSVIGDRLLKAMGDSNAYALYHYLLSVGCEEVSGPFAKLYRNSKQESFEVKPMFPGGDRDWNGRDTLSGSLVKEHRHHLVSRFMGEPYHMEFDIAVPNLPVKGYRDSYDTEFSVPQDKASTSIASYLF